MSDGNLPEIAQTLLTSIPAPMQAGALKAISRLIGNAADIPAAYMRRVSQGIEDQTQGASLVRQSVAQAAAQAAANDPELVQRALVGLLGDQARKQENKERVAEKAAEELATSSDQAPPLSEPDDDWLNVFARYTEDASSERMQLLWGRILAGEVRRPGAYSLKTLRFVSELDKSIADLFQEFGRKVVGDFVPHGQNIQEDVTPALELEAAGLLMGGEGMLSKVFTVEPSAPVVFAGISRVLVVKVSASSTFSVPAYVLTRIGREMLPLVSDRSDDGILEIIADKVPRAPPFESIELATLLHVGNSIMVAQPSAMIWRSLQSISENSLTP